MDKTMPPFCKVCGTLSPLGKCPKGHDSDLNYKIKDAVHAEDGTRVLISRNNVDLGKEFWHYGCENHHYTIYVLKVKDKDKYKDPPPFLQIPNSVNPCPKWHGNDLETFNLQDRLIPQLPRVKTEAERKLDNWVSYPNKRHT